MDVVAVPVATLWPEPAEGADTDRLTQLLLGDEVLVEEERGGWVRVVVPGQPAGEYDRRGYPGWLRAPELTRDGSTGDSTSYVVDALRVDLCATPAGEVVVGGVATGTRLRPAGPATGGWRPVRAGGADGWVPLAAIAPWPTPRGDIDPAAVVEYASRLVGTPYLWGGLTPAGIDCSGLIHLAWRRYGVVLPRDAREQAGATRVIPFGTERAGDLYFFARTGQRVSHVGFVTGPPDTDRHLLHAGPHVVREPVRGERAETLVAVHRVTW